MNTEQNLRLARLHLERAADFVKLEIATISVVSLLFVGFVGFLFIRGASLP